MGKTYQIIINTIPLTNACFQFCHFSSVAHVQTIFSLLCLTLTSTQICNVCNKSKNSCKVKAYEAEVTNYNFRGNSKDEQILIKLTTLQETSEFQKFLHDRTVVVYTLHFNKYKTSALNNVLINVDDQIQ